MDDKQVSLGINQSAERERERETLEKGREGRAEWASRYIP